MRRLLARVGFGSAPALTAPACVVCGAGAVLAGPLASAGLWSAAIGLHYLLWVLAPLNLLPLWLSFRHHRNPWGLRLAAAGALLIALALLAHAPFHWPVGMHDLIWVGVAFLIGGGLVDWRLRRQFGKISTIIVP